MKPLLLLFVAALAAGRLNSQETGPVASRPWLATSLAPEKRAELLVKAMTLDEKILEIHMVDVRDHPREVAAIERLGIPVFRITNGPVGAGPGDNRPTVPATALPSALALGASWDPSLATAYGALIGQEVKDRGEHLLEGPGVNITRVPQNGRNFEYFGEDPFLSARLGVAVIRAVQAQGVIAEVKHFAANNQEHDRKTVNETIDERTLREIYLPAFEAAVREGEVGAVMAAYPSVNGDFCSENPHLLKDILRGEWGFQGFVQSDYTGTHGAIKGGLAGLDLAMKPEHYADEMKAAVAGGKIPVAVVDTMLLRRFTEMFRFGMFDEPRSAVPIPGEADGALSRSIAEQCAVLLKNDSNLLPLDKLHLHSVAIIGPYAGTAHTGGGGSSAVQPLYTVSPVDGFVRGAGAASVVSYTDGTNLKVAVEAAKAADVALVMVGNKDSEGRDRTGLGLPSSQDELIAAVAAANPRTVVVLKTGGAVLMPWLDRVQAVLEVWYPGEEDGNVVADLIYGRAVPSGKLPLTFHRSVTETPVATPAQYPGIDDQAIYSEKLLVGYRWYDEKGVAPLFPFGFGLSYTTFSLANLTVAPPSAEGRVQVEVDLTNTGKRAGADVVQVYVSFPAAAGEPPRQLKGFAKATRKAGESGRVTVTMDRRAFSVWDVAKGSWVVIPGRYEIFVGDSSRDLPLTATIEMATER